jgi:pentapeptide repeat protein
VLRSSSLRGVNPERADLSGASLQGANLDVTGTARLRTCARPASPARTRPSSGRPRRDSGARACATRISPAPTSAAPVCGARLCSERTSGSPCSAAIGGEPCSAATSARRTGPGANLTGATWYGSTVGPSCFRPDAAVAAGTRPVPSPPVSAGSRVVGRRRLGRAHARPRRPPAGGQGARDQARGVRRPRGDRDVKGVLRPGQRVRQCVRGDPARRVPPDPGYVWTDDDARQPGDPPRGDAVFVVSRTRASSGRCAWPSSARGPGCGVTAA